MAINHGNNNACDERINEIFNKLIIFLFFKLKTINSLKDIGWNLLFKLFFRITILTADFTI